jgi:hypothetical protein
MVDECINVTDITPLHNLFMNGYIGKAKRHIKREFPGASMDLVLTGVGIVLGKMESLPLLLAKPPNGPITMDEIKGLFDEYSYTIVMPEKPLSREELIRPHIEDPKETISDTQAAIHEMKQAMCMAARELIRLRGTSHTESRAL